MNLQLSAAGEDSACIASTVPECDLLGEDTAIPQLDPDTRAAEDQTELPQQMVVVCQPDLACDSLPAEDNTTLHQASRLNRAGVAVVSFN